MCKNIMDQHPDGICQVNSDNILITANRAFSGLVQKSSSDLLGKPLPLILASLFDSIEIQLFQTNLDKIREKEEVPQWFFFPSKVEGRIVAAHLAFESETSIITVILRKDESFIGYSEREKKADKIASILHLVKNNFSLLLSMMDLQYSLCTTDESHLTVKKMSNRVIPLYLIQEELYREKDHTFINMNHFIYELSHRILMGISTVRVHTCFQIEDFCLNTDFSIPVGIIIEELLSNSCFHAFSEITNPEISIKGSIRDSQVSFLYKDNGKGMDEVEDPFANSGLGLRLIEALVDQLDGEIHFCNNGGLEVEFSFMHKLEEE